MATRTRKALVIGRTLQDVEECRMLHHPTHPPAPTTHLYSDYGSFDGDIITSQSIKYGAVAAGSIELSRRVMWSAEQNPGKVYVGTSQHAHDYQCPEQYRDKIKFLYTHEYDYPVANSGLFTLWLAVHLGYTEIYTVGLDLINITFTHGHKYDHALAGEYVRAYEQGIEVTGLPIETHLKDELSFNIANKIMDDNPNVQFYKCGNFSQLPCPVKIPN